MNNVSHVRDVRSDGQVYERLADLRVNARSGAPDAFAAPQRGLTRSNTTGAHSPPQPPGATAARPGVPAPRGSYDGRAARDSLRAQTSLQAALAAFQALTRGDATPPPALQMNLLEVLCQLGANRSAWHVFVDVRRAGHLVSPYLYVRLIRGAIDQRDHELARAGLRDMIASGVQGDVKTYTLLINAFGRNGNDVDYARVVLQAMHGAGVAPNLYTYNSLIHVYGSAGLWDQVQAIMAAMQRADIQPDTVTYNTLIKVLAQHGMSPLAATVFDVMRQRGVPIDGYTLSALARLRDATGG